MLTVAAGNEEIVPGDYAAYNGVTVGALRGSESIARLMQFTMEKSFSYTLKQCGMCASIKKGRKAASSEKIVFTGLLLSSASCLPLRGRW